MEFPAHIVFSCLLVCQPAIFVDSKRDGIRAAQRQKGLQDGYFGCYGEGQRPRGRDWLGGFCEELMARMDEDALDAVCDRIAPRYGVELAGSRYAA